MVERHFDLALGRVELIEGAVPGVELAGMDADPPAALVPKRRPLRSQTKSVSSQPASPCSLAGAMSRLATSTKARSAKGTPLAQRYRSRMPQSPN